MGRELFLDFFTEHEVPVIRKRRHTFLKMDDENVYILKEGVVKVSVLMRDGREFNIAYLKGFDILSMFKDAVVDCKFSSLMIRVESDEASFYCVSKELFNQLLNEHSELVEYVNTYYRKKLSETISRQELMTMNGKNGAVCAFIYYLVTMFGKEARDGILIDLKITNDDVAYRIRIRVESEEASFCLVSREDFSRAVKRDEKLKEYVEVYYRENLQRALYRQKCMTMNGKSGAIYAFLYNLISLFGKENEEGILIDMQVTNDDIAGFCGISTRNSVNRILRGLREENVIRIVDNKILILNAYYLKPYAD